MMEESITVNVFIHKNAIKNQAQITNIDALFHSLATLYKTFVYILDASICGFDASPLNYRPTLS